MENQNKVGGLFEEKTHGYLDQYSTFEYDPYLVSSQSWDVNINLPQIYEEDGIIDTNLYLGTAQNLDHGANLEIIKGEIPIVNYDYGSSSEVVPSECSSAIENKELVISNSYKNQDRRSKSTPLELNEIKKYFSVPITEATKELKVGLATLKKRCRELKIKRWPYRKIKSLELLKDTVKGLGLINEVKLLEQNKSMMEKVPQLELTKRTKNLRRACFKANNKTRLSLGVN